MLNSHNFSDKQIDDALRMKGGSRKVGFRYDLLNRNDIKIGVLDGISGVVSYGEFRAIKRSATFQLNEYLQKAIDYMSDQIQPWFILEMPDGGAVEWPLGIFLLESPNKEANGKILTRNIGAYDKTIIIEEDRFTSRYFIEAGTNYIGAITKILTTANIVKIRLTESNLTLLADREFPVGTKKKEAINTLLREINYNSISVDEMGYIFSSPYIEPSRRPITKVYTADKHSILHPKFYEETGLAGRPNAFIAIARNIESDTELYATFTNDDPLSPISTVNRGRKITAEPYILESIANQEALNNYIRRIAIEKTSAYSHLTFETVLMPDHGSTETLLLNIPDVLDAPQNFTETSWEMKLKHDGVMRHEARRVIHL